MANGSDWATPGVVDVAASARVWPTPIATPAAKAIGNERKLATSAAAIAASTRFVIVDTCSVTIGATRMPANPASPEPSDQLSDGDAVGREPDRAPPPAGSRPTAVVARPNFVYR